jgi:hypothetical protein
MLGTASDITLQARIIFGIIHRPRPQIVTHCLAGCGKTFLELLPEQLHGFDGDRHTPCKRVYPGHDWRIPICEVRSLARMNITVFRGYPIVVKSISATC